MGLLIGGVLNPAPAIAGNRIVREDSDNDSKTDRIVHLSPSGDLIELEADTSGDLKMDTFQYHRGVVERIERDTSGNGQIDQAIWFDDHKRPIESRHDLNQDGRLETFRHYKNGKLCSVSQLDNGRMILTRFQNDKPAKQTIDEDRDGQPEQTIIYNKQGNIDRAFSDTNRDGRIDVWQYYRQGTLKRAEQDRNHDGEVDVEFEYNDGQQVRLIMDNDGDGHFETHTAFDSAKWTKVTELIDKAGRVGRRLSYLGKVLRKKEVFDTKTGRLAKIEEFDQTSKIVMSKEAPNKTGELNLTWHYDGQENAVAAEKDTDGDGLTDIWYHYENGRVKRIEEDRNKDGKPDLWETYDAAQVLVYQSKDLDFDGTADIERRF